MPPRASKPTDEGVREIEIIEIERGELTLCLLGTSPGFLFHRQSVKVKEELLFPSKKKTGAEKERSLKHDPVQEFRDAPWILRDPLAPTLLGIPSTMLKSALRSAANDAGAAKAQIGRLVYVVGEFLPMYGIPKLHMSTPRQAGMTKAPDVRTRAVMLEWALTATIRFTRPHLSDIAIARLAAAAGEFIGIGDWRTEKGSNTYGGWRLVAKDNPDFTRIVRECTRDKQIKAMEAAECADEEAETLVAWFLPEAEKRGLKATKPGSPLTRRVA